MRIPDLNPKNLVCRPCVKAPFPRLSRRPFRRNEFVVFFRGDRDAFFISLELEKLAAAWTSQLRGMGWHGVFGRENHVRGVGFQAQGKTLPPTAWGWTGCAGLGGPITCTLSPG